MNHVGPGQAQKFIESGENLTQERFTKSRQRKQRVVNRVVVPPFPSSGNAYLRQNNGKPSESNSPSISLGKALKNNQATMDKASRGAHQVFKPNVASQAIKYSVKTETNEAANANKFPP